MSKMMSLAEQTADLAYRIYLEEGCPDGRQLEHWLRAEARLMAPIPVGLQWELFDRLQPEFWSNGVVC
jgi:hypothetical protein